MRRPPRSKSAPTLSTSLLYRIAFSATMIIAGTLFIYAVELSDGDTAQRDQTMVSCIDLSCRVVLTASLSRRPSHPSSFSISCLLSKIEAYRAVSLKTECCARLSESPSLHSFYLSISHHCSLYSKQKRWTSMTSWSCYLLRESVSRCMKCAGDGNGKITTNYDS